MTTPEAAELLRLGVCSRGHAVYRYDDVTPEGRCRRCADDMDEESRRVYGVPASRLRRGMRAIAAEGLDAFGAFLFVAAFVFVLWIER